MKTCHQIIRLQEVIIQLQHRLVDREEIECSAFICERVDALGFESFEGNSSALRRGARRVGGLETGEFFVCVGDLCRCKDAGEDHVAMLEDVVDQMCD